MISRRSFLGGTLGAVTLGACGATMDSSNPSKPANPAQPFSQPRELPASAAPSAASIDLRPPTFRNRGVVLTPGDLSLMDWPERAARAGLTTIALHTDQSPLGVLVPFILSDGGKRFVDRCGALGLAVEFEMHGVSDLLPRSLFNARPTLFRANAACERTPDANLCVHSPDALAIAADNALTLARALSPTTGRFYFWGDDGAPWCECACCAPLGASDQALVLENHLADALRSAIPDAQVAHLAYSGTLAAPTSIKPHPGVFLEFAPIFRRYDIAFDTPSDDTQRAYLDALDKNLAVFGTQGAQALEYWMDDSLFSRWTRPAVKLPFNEALVRADVATYHRRGIEHITSFAVFLDADYVTRFGDPPIAEYGSALSGMS